MNGFTGNISDFRLKSSGQLAYERELITTPTYANGSIRPQWSDLCEIARSSWNRTPTTHDEERTAWEHEQILAGLAKETPHSRIRQADGTPCQWTYNGDGSMLGILLYSCGCSHSAAGEPSRYYDHACASCYRTACNGKAW